MIKNRKSMLEARIARLEKLVFNSRKKFEGDTNAVLSNNEFSLFNKILKSRDDIVVEKCVFGPDGWFLAITDSDGDNYTTYDIYKNDDGSIEAWRDGMSRYSNEYDSIKDCADSIDVYDASLWGSGY